MVLQRTVVSLKTKCYENLFLDVSGVLHLCNVRDTRECLADSFVPTGKKNHNNERRVRAENIQKKDREKREKREIVEDRSEKKEDKYLYRQFGKQKFRGKKAI